MDTLLTVLMGLVEGITEFLPISSTGHLILADHWLDFKQHIGGKDAADAFEIIIQFGAILAVVAAYPHRFAALVPFGKTGRENRGFAGWRGLGLLFITSLPTGLLAFAARKPIKECLFNPAGVAAAMAIGAFWILVVERFRPRVRNEGLDSLSWRDAAWVGAFQCFSLWPGMSRSASTILGGMMAGVDRKTATEYSFLAAVPLLSAATAYELLKCHDLVLAHAGTFAVGLIVSFVSAWIAVKTFIHFLAKHTLVPFGWYRLAMAAIVLWSLR